MNDELYFLEKYVYVFYLFHIILSIIVAIFSAIFLKKRFINNTEEVNEKDMLRLKEVQYKSFMFRLWFKVSLHRNNPRTIFAFIFIFNLSLPVVGYLFTIWTVRYLNNVSYEKKVVDTSILNLDEFGSSFLKVERIFGEGSMTDLMVNEYAPKSKKLKALSSLANHATPANLQIIRQTLSSTDDEIRMFGYAIINKAEKALNSKINTYLEVIIEQEESDNDPMIIASAAKELAPLYWEMIYTELSHESLKNSFITAVIYYLDKAKEYYLPEISSASTKILRYEQEIQKAKLLENTPRKKEKLLEYQTSKFLENELKKEKLNKKKINETCTKLYILMGRVYMQQKEYENAKTEFTLAQELQDEKLIFILPYLAEIHFITGNYKVVKSIMKDAEGLDLNAKLFPIVEQWKVS